MKRVDKKSDCAINFSLESIGDPWSLLIVRDIVYYGKKTYGEFLASDERIGTSVLANRLAALEENGVLVKKPHKTDKRKEEYWLTEKGLDLIPILLDLAQWGAQHDPDTGADPKWTAAVTTNKDEVVQLTRKAVRSGGSAVVGENSVAGELGL